jgi:hypothetical protein
VWEDGLMASESALGRACRERDVECAQAEAAWLDYLARPCAFTSSSKHTINSINIYILQSPCLLHPYAPGSLTAASQAPRS